MRAFSAFQAAAATCGAPTEMAPTTGGEPNPASAVQCETIRHGSPRGRPGPRREAQPADRAHQRHQHPRGRASWPVRLRFHCSGPIPTLCSGVAREAEGARSNERISSRTRGSRSSAPSSAPRRGCASVTFGLGLIVLPAGSARRPTLLWTRGISPQRIGAAKALDLRALCMPEEGLEPPTRGL
jgi:hypothetical protein